VRRAILKESFCGRAEKADQGISGVTGKRIPGGGVKSWKVVTGFWFGSMDCFLSKSYSFSSLQIFTSFESCQSN
jgi:hypothetical protein